MTVVKYLSFYCWCIFLALMVHCSSSFPDNHAVEPPEHSFQRMSSRKIADGHWKGGNLKVSTNGKNEQHGDDNDENLMTFKQANDIPVSGIKTSSDRYWGPGFKNVKHMKQRELISEGRTMSQTTSSIKNLDTTHNRFEEGHGESIHEIDARMQNEIDREKWGAGLGNKAKTYLNEQSDTGFLKDVRFNYFLCGPQKACSCYKKDPYLYVNCSGKTLKGFPKSLPYEATIIDLSSNSISNISLADISSYPKLSRVSLAHNYIRDIAGLGRNKKILQMEYLDLSYNLLTGIPKLNSLSSLKDLSLSNNYIVDIGRESFLGMEQLTLLDMSYNDVQRMDETAFDSLVNLKYFYLNSNMYLGYSDRILSARLFEKLTRLEILWIQNNTNSTEDEMYPNKALGKLTSLKELAIDGLDKGVALGPELKNLSHLNRLMIGYRGKCYIETIQPDFFAHVKNLESLIFSSCNFTSTISPDAFMNLSKLEEYAISFPGDGYNLSKAFQDLEGLNHTNVTSLSLEGFKDTFELCRAVTQKDISYIKPLKLKTLNLKYDYYSGFEHAGEKDIPKTLERLLLRCNKLSTIGKRWSSLQHLTALYEVDLREQNVNCSTIADSQQKYQTVPPLIPSAARTILALDDKILNGKESECRKVAILCLKDDNPESFDNSTCNPDDLSVVCIPRNLRIIKSSGYNEFGKVLFTRKLFPNKICYLDFSRGLFTSWGEGTIPEGVKVADLGDNFCGTVSNKTFHVNNSLEYLCIENNYLGPVFANDVHGTIFSELKHLKYLNIAGNHIFDLEPSFFKGLSNLRDLNLMDNKLQHVRVNFSTMPKLRSIDLSKNSIKWISKQSRRQLDALAKDHPVFLDLSYNPLPCTCDGIEILQWLKDSNVRIKGSFLTCKDEKEESVPMGDIGEEIRALKRRCVANTYLIIASSFCCFLFLFIIVSGLLYKHRWKLIYARNIWLVNLYGFRPGGQVSSQNLYDAYVVYCEEDREFALDKMIEELEEKRGHKLCVEDRNFIPGSFNFNNVTCAIRNSTVTLLLLSPEFARAKELEYATQMALMEQYNNQTQRDLILLLRYREVPEKEMTKDLLMLMKKGRFLDYPENGDDSTTQGFWDRVSDEIGHTRSRSNEHMLDSNEIGHNRSRSNEHMLDSNEVGHTRSRSNEHMLDSNDIGHTRSRSNESMLDSNEI